MRDEKTIFILVAIMVAIAFFERCPTEVYSQGRPVVPGVSQDRPVVPGVSQDRPAMITPRVALLRLCVSELGFEGDERECAAIYHAILWRGVHRYNGADFVTSARIHSDQVFNLERRDHRAYIAHLRADCREPAGWPQTQSFTRGDVVVVRPGPQWTGRIRRDGITYQEGCRRIYAATAGIVAGTVHSATPRPAATWGMSSPHSADYQRMVTAGMDRLECVRSDSSACRNAFWEHPREEIADPEQVDVD